jgi:hypothetical protein
MTTTTQGEPDYVAVQLAHIEQTQAALALLQWQVIDIVKDPKLGMSPAILVVELLVCCTVPLCVGIAIGTLL